MQETKQLLVRHINVGLKRLAVGTVVERWLNVAVAHCFFFNGLGEQGQGCREG